VEKLLQGLRDSLDPRDRDHLVPKILMEMPHFPPTALATVQSYCEDLDDGRAKTGFISLHVLLKYRPPTRPTALPALLRYTRSLHKPLRRRAIEVCRKFWRAGLMRDEIEAFAVESMGLLSGITEGAYTCMLSSRALSSFHPHMPAQGSQGCAKHDHVAPKLRCCDRTRSSFKCHLWPDSSIG
jgi:hypothetical protein